MRRLIFAALAVVIVAMAALGMMAIRDQKAAFAADGKDVYSTPITPGQLGIVGPTGKISGACPLKHTDVSAEISGFVSRVEVVQHFTNPTQDKIEAVYTFPLPEDSAVDSMEMKIGSRVIVGEIHRREEARQIYEAAKEAGYVASLLDQERSNIFTQSVANIEPGAEVFITIRYTQILKYEAGKYSFVFPMVVGPRFIPGKETGKSGTGWAPDTDRVPDASNITPPVTPKGTRAGHDISVKVMLEAGITLGEIKSELHDVNIKYTGETSAEISLKDEDTIPNKDFVLNYKVAGDQIASGVITHAPGSNGGFFTLIMQPPTDVKPARVTPKEMIFVIDTSGSQSGEPIEKSKETMIHCIRNLNAGDTFNLIAFSNKPRLLFDKPQVYSAETEKKALDYIEACEAGGGTMLGEALDAALKPQVDSKRLRIVVFFTDGYIGNDMEVIDSVQKNIGSTRIFTFGIGNSVNRFLLEKMAQLGRGASDVVLLNSDSKQVASRFYNRIRNPILTDISIDWNGLPVQIDEVYPARIPDLFTAQPLIIKGRYTGSGSGEVIVRGKSAGKAWAKNIPVNFPGHDADNDALASIWARAKVEDLMDQDWLGAQNGTPNEKIKEAIVQTALNYNLMTQYTSFVAVERLIVTSGGKPITIAVPVEMPDGVSYDGVFGEADSSSSISVKSGKTYSMAAPSPLMAGSAGAPAMMRDEIVYNDAPVELTAEQKRENTLSQRLDKSLIDLIAKFKKANGKGEFSVTGKLVVADGKIDVLIWMKNGKLDDLAKLGAFDAKWVLDGKVAFASISIEKLEELALSDSITRIAPPQYK